MNPNNNQFRLPNQTSPQSYPYQQPQYAYSSPVYPQPYTPTSPTTSPMSPQSPQHLLPQTAKKKTENWVIELNEKKEDEEDLELAVTPTNGVRNLLGHKKKEKKPIKARKPTPSVTAATDVRVTDIELKENVVGIDESKKRQSTSDTKDDKTDAPRRKISDTMAAAKEIMNDSSGKNETSKDFRPTLKQLMEDYYNTRHGTSKFKWTRLKRWWSNGKVQKFFETIDPLARTTRAVEKGFGTGIATYYEFYITIIRMNLMIFCCTFFLLVLPWLIRPIDSWPTGGEGATFAGNFILGLIGYKSDAIGKYFFFFGGYESFIQIGALPWSFAFFYCFSIMLYFFLCMLTIVREIGRRFSKIDNLDNENFKYVTTVFNMWDHSLDKQAAVTDLKRAISSRLQELLTHDQNKAAADTKLTGWPLAKVIICRTIGIFVSAVLIAGAPTSVVFITEYYTTLNKVFPVTTSILTAVINVVFPLIITFMVKLEGYQDAKYHNYNIIGRTYVIKMATTVALMVRVIALDEGTLSDGKCRTTEAGLVFWQMLLIDFVMSFVITIVSNVASFLIQRFIAIKKDPENGKSFKLEFDTSGAVISLLYRQALLWIGTTMSPMLPLIGVVSNFVLFFVQYIIMAITCKFPENPIANAKSHAFTFLLMLMTMVFALIPVFYFMLQPADIKCGPYAAIAGNWSSTYDDGSISVAGISSPTTIYNIGTYVNGTYVNSTYVAAPIQVMSYVWNNNPLFKLSSKLVEVWTYAMYYIFHPLTLFVIMVAMLVTAYFVNQRRKMYIMMLKNAQARAQGEHKNKVILLLALQEAEQKLIEAGIQKRFSL